MPALDGREQGAGAGPGGSVGKDAGAEALVMGIHTLPGAVVVYRSGLVSAGPEARAGLPRQAPPRQRPR